MIVYTKHISKRLEYVLDLSLNRIMGLHYSIINSLNEIKSLNVPVLNYSHEKIEHSFTIHPHKLLFEEHIVKQSIQCNSYLDKLPVFFETDSKDFPFDIFSAIFYLVSRYEEYLPFIPDKHNRFPASASLAYKYDFLKIPVINMWINSLKKRLLVFFPDLEFKKLAFEYIPTIDVDLPWAYLHKPFVNISGGILKELFHKNLDNVIYRLKVISKTVQDPYDTFSEWDEIHGKAAAKLKIFILAGITSKFDMKTSPYNKSWQDLVKLLSAKYQAGIHPSYNSDLENKGIDHEKRIIESLSENSIYRSRQHFIKIRFPNTYRRLLNVGIREDYSMGYPDYPGFRAGLAFPFPFFDLERNMSTGLIIYPFCVMDRTLKDYMGLNPSGAMKTISQLLNTVNDAKGLFISIWHNDSLGDFGEWKGWKKVYLQMINMANILSDA